MLHQNHPSEKCEQPFEQTFSTLKIGQLLRGAGIKKSFGLSSIVVFKIIFALVFEGRNLYRQLQSDRGQALPGKDVIYRFLNYPKYAWRRFLHGLGLTVVQYFEGLTSPNRTKVFIVDDSVLCRDRSKKAELLARIHDHTVGRFVRGYSLLTLGWSDGFSFAPIDFVMHSSAKKENRYCEMRENLDKRTHGYNRRNEALQKKPDTVVQMLQNALSAGFTADYVLMDSWFTHAPLLRAIDEMGLHTIGMVKNLKQRYLLKGEHLALKDLYAEIVRIYGMRWNIETFFKFAKSHLKLGTEFQGRSYDMFISHTTIVFSRYLILEWERRQNCDYRTLGGLFFVCCDEVRDVDLKTALLQLIQLFISTTDAIKNKDAALCQLRDWIAGLPSYIRGLLANLSCES